MPTTLAFAPSPEDLTDIFLEAPVLCQSSQPPAPPPDPAERAAPEADPPEA